MAYPQAYSRPLQDPRNPFAPSRGDYGGSESDHGDTYGSTTRLAGPHVEQDGPFNHLPCFRVTKLN
jgi:hypothetical protein